MQPEHHSLSRREVLWKMGAFASVASLGGRTAQASTPASHAPSIDVRELGAQGDGKADDTPAFEKAIEAARSAGLAVFVPRGVYRLTRTLVVENISLSGPTPWRVVRRYRRVAYLAARTARQAMHPLTCWWGLAGSGDSL
jgi:hypothetical protein